jgi:hypothetical protein
MTGSADGKSRWLMMPAAYRPMGFVVARQAHVAIGVLAAMLALAGLVAPQAGAADVDAAIVFAVDVSASIDRGTADLQREGHAAALCAPEIIAAIARNRIGCIGIVYFEWSSRGHWTNVLPWTTVCRPSEAQAAAAIIREAGDTGDGSGGRGGTSVSYAIDMGSLLLGEFPGSATNKIIDISANGPNNDGLPVEQSRLRAIAKGYTINAIAIPSYMRGIEHDNSRYFAENVIGGPGAFVVAPATTHDYAAAIRRKLVDEISLAINGSIEAKSVESVQSIRPLAGAVNLLSRAKRRTP